MLTLHPLARAVLGGLAAALAVAGPLVDDGVLASEAIAIALAFLSGSGLTAVRSGREPVAEVVPVDEDAYL